MTTQKLFFVTKENRKNIPVGENQIERVWTLFQYDDESVKPELPYSQVHHKNTFLESGLHDYSITKGVI